MVHQEIILMLQSYFKNQSIDSTPSNELLHLVKEQSLSQYLYPIYKVDGFKKFYFTAVIVQEKFRLLQQEITTLFNTKQIAHFYIKGSVLHTLYPDIALRTRGDIDVVIHPNDTSKASSLLQENGFEQQPMDNMHHLEFKKNNLIVELHFALFDDYGNNFYYHYFKNPFEMCKQYESYLYYLQHEYHYAYCLCHFARHLKTGAGIRYIFDFYYMLKNWQLDLDLLQTIIQKLKLERLQQCVLNTIKYITGDNLIYTTEEDMAFFIDYLLHSGIHGNGNNENLDDKFIKTYDHKFRYMFARLFMTNNAYRISLYPKLGKHWYTYIFCLFHHAFYLITHKLKKFFKLLFRKKNAEDKQKEMFFKKIGIKE